MNAFFYLAQAQLGLRKLRKAKAQNDTSVSKAQHNAMEAAAHGNGTLGIPKNVAKEFVEKDKATGAYDLDFSNDSLTNNKIIGLLVDYLDDNDETIIDFNEYLENYLSDNNSPEDDIVEGFCELNNISAERLSEVLAVIPTSQNDANDLSGGKWVTIGKEGEGKRKVHFDKDGKIDKGLGSWAHGKTMSDAMDTIKAINEANLTPRQKLGRKIAAAGAAKFGGSEREYRNLGTKKGQADSFAHEYLKTGYIPEGHLRDAVSEPTETDNKAKLEKHKAEFAALVDKHGFGGAELEAKYKEMKADIGVRPAEIIKNEAMDAAMGLPSEEDYARDHDEENAHYNELFNKAFGKSLETHEKQELLNAYNNYADTFGADRLAVNAVLDRYGLNERYKHFHWLEDEEPQTKPTQSKEPVSKPVKKQSKLASLTAALTKKTSNKATSVPETDNGIKSAGKESIIKALMDYQSTNFENINTELRYEKPSTENKKIISEIDNVATKKTTEPLYKGMDSDFVKALKSKYKIKDISDIEELKRKLINKDIKDKSFMSTSKDLNIAADFARDKGTGITAIIQINGEKTGVDLNDYLNNAKTNKEKEFLLKRNSSLKITDVKISKTGKLILFAENKSIDKPNKDDNGIIDITGKSEPIDYSNTNTEPLPKKANPYQAIKPKPQVKETVKPSVTQSKETPQNTTKPVRSASQITKELLKQKGSDAKDDYLAGLNGDELAELHNNNTNNSLKKRIDHEVDMRTINKYYGREYNLINGKLEKVRK
jgi:hypothetical protein